MVRPWKSSPLWSWSHSKETNKFLFGESRVLGQVGTTGRHSWVGATLRKQNLHSGSRRHGACYAQYASHAHGRRTEPREDARQRNNYLIRPYTWHRLWIRRLLACIQKSLIFFNLRIRKYKLAIHSAIRDSPLCYLRLREDTYVNISRFVGERFLLSAMTARVTPHFQK